VGSPKVSIKIHFLFCCQPTSCVADRNRGRPGLTGDPLFLVNGKIVESFFVLFAEIVVLATQKAMAIWNPDQFNGLCWIEFSQRRVYARSVNSQPERRSAAHARAFQSRNAGLSFRITRANVIERNGTPISKHSVLDDDDGAGGVNGSRSCHEIFFPFRRGPVRSSLYCFAQ
jgi:hypothetical protein